MVLVDTSVWIRFLADRPPFAAELQRLLEADEVAAHDLVFGELLIGDKGGRRTLLDAYQRMQTISAIPHPDVVAFVRARKLHGRGAGWIDIHLLASALVGWLPSWTADPQARYVGA
ncbi:MAG: PIN domain-containing protein [Acidobacteriota bacterium]